MRQRAWFALLRREFESLNAAGAQLDTLSMGMSSDLEAAILEGARLRLRPILMTSFAFILGCVPLWKAQGAGAIGRKVLGSSVITGMSAATVLGVFFVPVLFVVIERIAKKKVSAEVPRPVVFEGGHD